MALKIDTMDAFAEANAECMRRAAADRDKSANPQTFDMLSAFVWHKENYWRNPLPAHTDGKGE